MHGISKHFTAYHFTGHCAPVSHISPTLVLLCHWKASLLKDWSARTIVPCPTPPCEETSRKRDKLDNQTNFNNKSPALTCEMWLNLTRSPVIVQYCPAETLCPCFGRQTRATALLSVAGRSNSSKAGRAKNDMMIKKSTLFQHIVGVNCARIYKWLSHCVLPIFPCDL